ncbi:MULTISPECIES: hypothetical protein [unclassified Aureimonas]|uniref:hypothetical protein n=1 Tax=unclassified Aureimonas TaxID=2615206 RepID=UPI0006FBC3D0|nr:MULTISPECIES: hypothetical protein [unclassified Aureimonas]KQT60362.1 hypothetical protein ASG62_06810 [Aureimonas sp. Leaf427]KQT79240.1 hypothetical protein ASG54_09410 [Aureimonas sp. Leaf460]
MTAIVITMHDHGFDICSDGASYRPETLELAGLAHKVALLPVYSGFLTYRGVAAIMPIFEAALDDRFTSFDEIVESADVLTHQAAQFVSTIRGQLPDFTIYIGGWSEDRERFELYAISATDRKTNEGGEARKAFVVTPIEWCVIAPAAPREILASLGLVLDDGNFDLTPSALPKFIHAARLSDIEEGGAIAGGFIQETTIRRNTSQTHVLYRYDDVQGDVMIPTPKETADVKRICDERAAAYAALRGQKLQPA